MSDEIIIQKLEKLEKLMVSQVLLQKDVLNFQEACQYTDLSQSHMYKLTSKNQIPFSCPQGKRLYFKRTELDEWLLRNRNSTLEEIDNAAIDYLIQNKRRS